MENAGRAVAEQCGAAKEVAIFCGRGGNGGDGLVAARHLHNRGRKVTVMLLPHGSHKDFETNLKILEKSDIKLINLKDSSELAEVESAVKGCDVVVDALLGVGAKGELREPLKGAVEFINSLSSKKISIDVPTGDEELKVKADTVVALHSSKTPDSVVVDIGIAPEAEKYCGPGDVYDAIPLRKPSAHKGDYGRVLIVGGSKDFFGAPALAGAAALAAGCDLVTVAAPKGAADKIKDNLNLMVTPLASETHLTCADLDDILKINFDVLLIGNGLGLEDETREAVRELASKVKTPVVADADALKALKLRDLRSSTVVTPHGREFEALFGEYDEARREKLTARYAKKSDAIVLLKGAVDVVSDGKTTRLNRSGAPGMTVGGTGDVLAGLVAGLVAQNRDPFASACAATFLNGVAGELAYNFEDVSVTATDVLAKIPEAVRACKSGDLN